MTTGLFPCRSYGACMDLLAQVYKQVAPNGAFNPLRFPAFQKSQMPSSYTRAGFRSG
jgi:hypothetical protein